MDGNAFVCAFFAMGMLSLQLKMISLCAVCGLIKD